VTSILQLFDVLINWNFKAGIQLLYDTWLTTTKNVKHTGRFGRAPLSEVRDNWILGGWYFILEGVVPRLLKSRITNEVDSSEYNRSVK
jgi:hypothetical protein